MSLARELGRRACLTVAMSALAVSIRVAWAVLPRLASIFRSNP